MVSCKIRFTHFLIYFIMLGWIDCSLMISTFVQANSGSVVNPLILERWSIFTYIVSERNTYNVDIPAMSATNIDFCGKIRCCPRGVESPQDRNDHWSETKPSSMLVNIGALVRRQHWREILGKTGGNTIVRMKEIQLINMCTRCANNSGLYNICHAHL